MSEPADLRIAAIEEIIGTIQGLRLETRSQDRDSTIRLELQLSDKAGKTGKTAAAPKRDRL